MLTALIPVFIIILLGYLFKRLALLQQPFWAGVEQLTYFGLFPALLFEKLARAPLDIMTTLPMALSLMLTICAMSLVLFVSRPLLGFPGPGFTSVFQGSIRFNTFVALAGASTLFGDSGLTLAAVLLLGMIPLINLFCVFTLSRYGRGQQATAQQIILEILRNPLILACLIGFVYNLTQIPQPQWLFSVFELLGQTALPLGLLAVGAGLQLQTLKNSGKGIILSSLCKLILFPLSTAAFCFLFGVQGEPRSIALIFSAVPTAVSAFILARQLGGDTDLMASIITIQTIFSIVTLPLMLQILKI